MNFKEIGLKDLYVDLNGEITTPLYAKQGEINSRGLRIFIVDNGKPVNTIDSKLIFYGKVEDSKVYEKEATQILDEVGVYELVYPQSILKPGIVEVELSLKNEDSTLLSKTFNIDVDYRVVSGIIEEIDDPDLVSSLIEAGTNETLRVENELVRQTNEVVRINLYEQIKSDYQEGLFKGEDGKDGYTPIKGVDYFDGEQGLPGRDGTDGVDIEELNTLLSVKVDNETVGNLVDLNTNSKSDIVSAINEVKAVSDTFDDAHNQEIIDIKDSIETIELTPGPQGPAGKDGKDGQQGLSAYQIWLYEGNSGTEAEFLESLKGADGSGGGGGNLGTTSSSTNLSGVTNEHTRQISVSFNSSASGGRSQVNASTSSNTIGQNSQINASIGSTINGYESQINASTNSNANAFNSQVNTSDGVNATGAKSQVNSSVGTYSTLNGNRPTTSAGERSQINSSLSCETTGLSSQVNSSSYVKNETPYSSAWGRTSTASSARTSNIKIHLLAETGNILNAGVVTSGHSFTDFAELFPNLTGVEQGYGLIQTIDGPGVRPANEGEQAVGVTSATAGLILGETPFAWQARWLKDDWGDYVYHDILDMEWEPSDEEVESDRPMITVPKENPEYDPELEHETRQQRPDEWTVVGLVGQVYVRLKDDVQPMDYVTPWQDGIGQTSPEPTNLRLMKVTKDYVAEDGYKIGFCLLK